MGPPRAHRDISTVPRRPGLTPPSYSQPWKGGGTRGFGAKQGTGTSSRAPARGDEAVLTPRTATSHQRIPLLLTRGHLQGSGARNPPAPHHGDGTGTPPPSPLIPALGTARAHRSGAFTRAPPWPAVMGSNPAEKRKKKTVKGTEVGYGTAGALRGPVCCSRAALGLFPKP